MIDFDKLKEPFPADDIEWRSQRTGGEEGNFWAMVLAYVTNRAIMERLDDVCGPENWYNEFRPAPNGGVMCGISIRIDNDDLLPNWVTKWDGADNTKEEAVKGGLSGAMKRAGVQWGIGRYLYKLQATFVKHEEKGTHRNDVKHWETKKKIGVIKWNDPTLPDWALPKLITEEQMSTWTDIASSADISVKDLSLKFGLTKRTTEKDADEMIKQALAHYQK